jgi:lipoprotein-releasing system ATP-binding protein
MIEVQGKLAINVANGSESNRLHVVDVRKSFTGADGSRIEVLRGVMMEVSRGESVAIMGASGSGKSTLLHLLGGLDEPDHGFINLGPIEVAPSKEKDPAEFRRKQIGFVFQFHYLLNDLTAVENVAMPLLLERRKHGEALNAAHELLAAFDLADRADHPVSQLSGGELQRVAVARALINEPLLILADEPTGNLDSVIGDGIATTLVDYARKRSKMAVIATHNDHVAGLCDRIVELKSGCIYPRAR